MDQKFVEEHVRVQKKWEHNLKGVSQEQLMRIALNALTTVEVLVSEESADNNYKAVTGSAPIHI